MGITDAFLGATLDDGTPPSEPATAVPAPNPLAAMARLWVSLGAGCVARGAAMHLGGGRFLTAAHLLDGSLSPPGCDGPVRAVLMFGGQELRARPLRQGRSEKDASLGLRYLAGHDLALLQTSPPPLPEQFNAVTGAVIPCNEPAIPEAETLGIPASWTLSPGQVVVLTPRRRTVARLLSPVREGGTGYGTYDEIDIRLEPGESGGAVFNRASGCLLGLVSHREGGAPRTRLVPAPAIRSFLTE